MEIAPVLTPAPVRLFKSKKSREIRPPECAQASGHCLASANRREGFPVDITQHSTPRIARRSIVAGAEKHNRRKIEDFQEKFLGSEKHTI
jgi:hypothetical protein